MTYLVDGEIDASVGHDADEVRHVATVQVAVAFARGDLVRAVVDTAVLLRLA